MTMNIEDIKREVIPACSEFEVHKLFVFSSFARVSESLPGDLSFFVEFDSPEITPTKRYLGLLHELKDVFKGRIDLVMDGSIRTSNVMSRIKKERVLIYAK